MKKVIGMIMAMLLLLTACSQRPVSVEPPPERFVPVETGHPTVQTLFASHSYSGRILPNNTYMVIPKMVGKVSSVQVKVGDRVRGGQVLFSLEQDDVKRQVEQARLSMEAAQANLALAKSQQSLAKATYERNQYLMEDKLAFSRESFERNKALYEAGALSPIQFQQAQMMHQEEVSMLRAQLEQAEFAAGDSSVRLAEVSVRQSQLAYQQASDALANTVVTSPSTGLISVVNAQVGEFVSTAQPAMVVVDVDIVKVQVDVSQTIINKIFPGMHVFVGVSATGESPYEGEIHTVSPAPLAQTGLYPATILLQNSHHVIKPGMFAEVTLRTDERTDALTLESRAVLERGGREVVFVAEGNRAREIAVETGLRSGEYVEILAGLTVDDMVILRGQQYVQDGSLIEVARSR